MPFGTFYNRPPSCISENSWRFFKVSVSGKSKVLIQNELDIISESVEQDQLHRDRAQEQN